MRLECGSMLVALLCACTPEQPADPIGARFWIAAGGFSPERVEMFRADDLCEAK